MEQILELLLLLWAAICSDSLAEVPGSYRAIACPSGVGQEIISNDVSLLNTDNIVASSARIADPTEHFINFDFDTQEVWCTPSSGDPNPTIDITFSKPVVITGLLSGGYTYSAVNTEYVTNFTLEYSSSLGSGGPLEFAVPTINLFLPICPPIVAESVHFLVLDSQLYIGDVCWGLAFFGCPLPEEFNMSTSSVLESTSSYSQYTSMPAIFSSSSPSSSIFVASSPTPSMGPSGGGAEPSSLEETKVEKDYMVVAIVLPIAILTILIVAAIVAVGVFLCVRNSNKWSPAIHYSRPRSETDTTVKFVDNSELYQPGTVVQTNERRRPMAREHASEQNSRPGETADCTYESVSPQPEGTAVQDMEELLTNPLYGASGEHEDCNFNMERNQSYGDRPAADEGTAEYAYPSVTIPTGPADSRPNIYEDTN